MVAHEKRGTHYRNYVKKFPVIMHVLVKHTFHMYDLKLSR
jgi:hypothetical protein